MNLISIRNSIFANGRMRKVIGALAHKKRVKRTPRSTQLQNAPPTYAKPTLHHLDRPTALDRDAWTHGRGACKPATGAGSAAAQATAATEGETERGGYPSAKYRGDTCRGSCGKAATEEGECAVPQTVARARIETRRRSACPPAAAAHCRNRITVVPASLAVKPSRNGCKVAVVVRFGFGTRCGIPGEPKLSWMSSEKGKCVWWSGGGRTEEGTACGRRLGLWVSV
ncbi:hypothetical protein C8R43DRAFT_957927 [Mycena crocata]|nr:hypothetical protein C8R43DRAFT_957927 [Mycena crocata]